MKNLNGATIGFDDFDGAARVCAARRGATLFQAALQDAGGQLAAALADGTRCAAAAPPSATLSLPLERPPVDAAKFSRAIPQLLDAHLPMPVADCAFAAFGYGGSGASLVAFAVRKTDLESRIATLAASGANPARIVPLAHAVWSAASRDDAAARGAGARPGEPARPLFVAIAGRTQVLLAIGSGSAPETQIICRANPEEIAARLKLAFHGGAQAPVCVAAGENHAVAAAAFAAFPGAKIITPESPEFYAAKALATDKPAGGWFQDANLRSGALAHKSSAAAAGRRFAAAMLSLGLFAALLFAASGLRLAEAKRAATASANALQTALDDVAGYNVRTKGARAVEDAKRAAAARFDPELDLHRRNPIPSAIFQAMAHCADNGITIKRLVLSSDGATASGSAPMPAAADELAKKLAALGFDSQLAEPPKPDADGMFQFMIAPLKK